MGIRHVGDAVVVFQERCVIPLFLASFPSASHVEAGSKLLRTWEPPQQVGRRRLAVPEEGFSMIAFGQSGLPPIGRTVWTTPLPLPGASGAVRSIPRLKFLICGSFSLPLEQRGQVARDA